MSLLKEKVLVLNKSWISISTITVEAAFKILFRDAAQVVCPESYTLFPINSWLEKEVDHKKVIQTSSRKIEKPEIILLTSYSKVPNRNLAYTRKNLYRRDNYTCQYCYKKFGASRLTVDHVIPRSLGGPTTWENCVLACVVCNSKKGSKSVKECGYKLLKEPRKPEWSPVADFFGKIPKTWLNFLPNSS